MTTNRSAPETPTVRPTAQQNEDRGGNGKPVDRDHVSASAREKNGKMTVWAEHGVLVKGRPTPEKGRYR
jgi:hypothetical protein